MPKTTVIWKVEPQRTEEESKGHQERRSDMAESIAGSEFRVHQTMEINDVDGTVTVVRDWPDEATAKTWVEFVLADGALFATVMPE